MGGTKSKVDGTPEEESEPPSLTSESTNVDTEQSHDRHAARRTSRHRSTDRRYRRRDRYRPSRTPSPDENLSKPFTYRSRKDRLLESLTPGAGDSIQNSTDGEKSNKNGKTKQISVQKIVENIQANLNAKSGSSTSIRKVKESKLKNVTKSKNAVESISQNSEKGEAQRKKSYTRKRSQQEVVPSKEVKPTGTEEKIIESLIQPKRRGSLQRSGKIRNTFENVTLHTNPVALSLDNSVSENVVPKPPELPPIDFSSDSEFEEESDRVVRRQSKAGSKHKDVFEFKPLEPISSRTMPSHLKELKMRFTNDVPRSPHEDNLNADPVVEKCPSKSIECSSNSQDCPPTNSSLDNNIPVADSLHILNEECSPMVVIKGAKGNNQEKKFESRSKYKKSFGADSDSAKNVDTTSDITKKGSNINVEKRQSKSINRSSTREITKSSQDDVIKCFSVKTDYKKDEDCVINVNQKNYNSPLKSARTQTSSLGLVESGVQTLPDLAHHSRKLNMEDEEAYDSAIESKARRVLRRVSKDRSLDRQTCKDRKSRRYRNGSTQWENIDLLNNSSCSIVGHEKEQHKRNTKSHSVRVTRNSRSELKINEGCTKRHCREPNDTAVDLDQNDVYCMHMQLVQNRSRERRLSHDRHFRRKHSDTSHCGRRDAQDYSRRKEIKYCDRCSNNSGFSSSEKVSMRASYTASTTRSHELSLLSPFHSTSSIHSDNRSPCGKRNSDNVYRQMEELGLGFLRDGEWID